jgi:hypothetical protein
MSVTSNNVLRLNEVGYLSGNYSVRAKIDSCQSQISAGTVLSTPAHKASANLKLFPNPAKDQFFVNVTNPTKIQVLNTLGQVVILQALESGRNVIDNAVLPAGMYTVLAEGYKATSLVISK